MPKGWRPLTSYEKKSVTTYDKKSATTYDKKSATTYDKKSATTYGKKSVDISGIGGAWASEPHYLRGITTAKSDKSVQ